MDQASSPSSNGTAREPTAERAPPPSTLPARAQRAPGMMITPDDARAAIAAKIASVRPKAAKPSAEAGTAPGPTGPPSSGPEKGDGAPQSLENSILAAIAEAVDVLVEDGDTEAPNGALVPASPPGPTRKRPPPAPPASAAGPPVEQASPRERIEAPARPVRPRAEPRRLEGDDIGDEIQRIIATYNRNRKDEPKT
jgi:hypothetical protein